MMFKFRIGHLTVDIGKSKFLGGFRFKFEVCFYGKKYYKCKKNIRELKQKMKKERLCNEKK